MANHYTNPEAEVVLLSAEDVITTSGETGSGSGNGSLEDILTPPTDEGWGGFN